jgi:hypothetical protein
MHQLRLPVSCPICGSVIERQAEKGRRQRFCSVTCRMRAHRSRSERYVNAPQWVTADAPNRQFRNKENQRLRGGQNTDLEKARLSWIEVNEVTWKLTDGRGWRTPASFGQWPGYDTEWPVAWVIDTGWPMRKSLWYARRNDQSWGPSTSFARAKEAALGLVLGAPLPEDEHAQAFTGEIDLTAVTLPTDGGVS